MIKKISSVQELLALRDAVLREIDDSDPKKKIAKIDGQISQAREAERQAENERKAEELAKKRARARDVYLETVKKLVDLSDSLNELAKYSLVSPHSRLPILFVRQVEQTIDHIRLTDPEALGLPPRLSPEEREKRERQAQIKHLQTIADDYREKVKAKGDNWQKAEERLEEIQSAIAKLQIEKSGAR